MQRWLIPTLALFVFAAFAFPARAEGVIAVTANKFTNNFPTRLLFQIAARSPARISKIALTVQVDGQTSSSRYLPEFTPDVQVDTSYEWNIQRNYVPPGVSGQFWWMLQDDAGNQLQTPKQNFRVEDSAQTWQKLANNKLAFYWYAGGDGFGRGLFDRAVEAISYLEKDTGVTVDQQVQIWIYGNRADFFRALGPGARDWTGGRALPEYGIILINVEPGALEWGKAATAHELTHIIIHERIRGPLGSISMPQWMDEGLAVYYETIPNKLDGQFSGPLKRAIDSNTLLSLRSISGNFPSNGNDASLAYGEGFSVVDFIIRRYGASKLAQLLQAFKAGGDFDDIFKQVLNVDTDGLENLWRKDIGAKPREVAPRVRVAPSPMPTFGLSTDPFVAPSPTPQAVALNATPAPAPASEPRAPEPIVISCGNAFAFAALAFFGAMRARNYFGRG
ncbi:MAG: hypothetical protein HY327_09870 [Chloroflexi bacterium]|nr:hypothetical protein [Chloroflexota bacterium]